MNNIKPPVNYFPDRVFFVCLILDLMKFMLSIGNCLLGGSGGSGGGGGGGRCGLTYFF